MSACRFLYSNLIDDPAAIEVSSARPGLVGMPVAKAQGTAQAYAAGLHTRDQDQVFLVEIDSLDAGSGVGQATFRWRRLDREAWEASRVPTSDRLGELADGVQIKWASGGGNDFILGDCWSLLASRAQGSSMLLDGDRDSGWAALGAAGESLTVDLGQAGLAQALILADHNLSGGAVATLLASDPEEAGRVWSDLGQQFGQTQIMALCGLGDGVVLAGAAPNGKVLRSTDGGLTWADLGGQAGQTQIMSLCDLGDGVVLAGAAPNGKILRSSDGGLTWADLGGQAGQTQIMALCGLGGGVVLAGSGPEGKVLRSTDGGLTWADLGGQAEQTQIMSLCALDAGVALAGGGPAGRLLRSTCWDQPALGQSLAVTRPHLVAFPEARHRLWRLVLSDPDNPEGGIFASLLYLGGIFQPSRMFGAHYGHALVAGRATTASDAGKLSGSARGLAESWRLSFRGLNEDDLASFRQMFQAIHDSRSGRLRPLFFIPFLEEPGQALYALPGPSLSPQCLHQGSYALDLELEEVVRTHV